MTRITAVVCVIDTRALAFNPRVHLPSTRTRSERTAPASLRDDTAWLPMLIGINDLVVGSALIAAVWLSRFRPVVLAWAGVWLMAVSAIRLTSMT